MTGGELQALFGEWGVDDAGVPLPLTYRTFVGTGAHGPVYDGSGDLAGTIRIPQNRLVRNADGQEVLSSTRLFIDSEDVPKVPLHSLVDLGDGMGWRTVVTIENVQASGMFGHAVVHVE